MSRGILFVIVGASGVGKDTLIEAALPALGPRYVQARRVITRPAATGEDHVPVTEDEFSRRSESGEFLHEWQAHGLRYGLPSALRELLTAGRHVIANSSRAALARLAEKVSPLVIVEITAPAALLRQRIEARGREQGAAVEARLGREAPLPDGLPTGIPVIRVRNDGCIEDGARTLAAVLEHAACTATPGPAP